MGAFDTLLSPVRVGPMAVRNRIVETTYSINSGRLDGLPDPPFIEHHLARARGGAGWIGNETWLLPTPLPPGRPDEILPGMGAVRFAPHELPAFVDRMRTFTDAVHAAGSVCVMQLTHLQSLMAPSPVQLALSMDHVPHELDEDEIEAILETYPRAAERMQAGGADGVEIHCAHETLPQWFLSPFTNRREDAFGGGIEGRTRFVVEAVRRVRERVPAGLAVGLRICADEHREEGYDLAQMKEMIAHVTASVPVDFLNVDVGSTYGHPSYVPPMQVPVAAFSRNAREIRQVVASRGVRVIYAGRVNDPAVAERLVADGSADLVGMTRALLADPELPEKLREGRAGEIRKCIACNSCIGKVIHAEVKTAICAVNPVVGHELDWKAVVPAPRPRRVVVVGGGPGGIEAARAAALRGHHVTLLEREAQLGGAMGVAARAPLREAFLDFPRWAAAELPRIGVEVRTSSPTSAAEVLALAPDVVVVATGGLPRAARFPGGDAPHVVSFVDVLLGRCAVGARVAVVSEDDHMVTPSVADFLASTGRHVEVLHKWLMIGDKVERYTRGIVFQRLYAKGVVLHPSTRVRRVEGGTVVAFNAHTGEERRLEGFDTVVLCIGLQANDGLHRELKGRVAELHLVGSAFAPRLVADATQHGHAVGRLV